MISIFLIIAVLLIYPSTSLIDDYSENISVNAGETATFICDLPEKYSNKRVSSQAIDHVLFFLHLIINKHNKHDYVVISLGKYFQYKISMTTMTVFMCSRRISMDPRDAYSWSELTKIWLVMAIEHDFYLNTRTWLNYLCSINKERKRFNDNEHLSSYLIQIRVDLVTDTIWCLWWWCWRIHMSHFIFIKWWSDIDNHQTI